MLLCNKYFTIWKYKDKRHSSPSYEQIIIIHKVSVMICRYKNILFCDSYACEHAVYDSVFAGCIHCSIHQWYTGSTISLSDSGTI